MRNAWLMQFHQFHPTRSSNLIARSGMTIMFGVSVYSFMCQHSLPSLISPITDQSQLSRMLFLVFTIVAAFYYALVYVMEAPAPLLYRCLVNLRTVVGCHAPPPRHRIQQPPLESRWPVRYLYHICADVRALYAVTDIVFIGASGTLQLFGFQFLSWKPKRMMCTR